MVAVSRWLKFLGSTDSEQTDHDPTRQLRHEDVFVEVESIKNGVVSGRIANKMDLLTNYKRNQRILVKESEVKNWLILRPDGVEEGNYVGKFLDHYKPR